MRKELTSEQKTAYQKQYYQDHKPEKAAYNKRYRQDNKIELAAQTKRYAQDNKVEIAARHKQYNQDHRSEINARRSNRKVNDIDYKLKINFGREIKRSIKGVKQYKHSVDLLGCTISEVREHLERQFTPGMTWNNWNLRGWHIDHIIPLEYFDFSDYEQQKRAWNYTNLRPLWAEENLKKGSKIIEKQLILM